MLKAKRTPLDLMDDIYNLAYWMTGSETETNELVSRTYLNVDMNSSDTEVFKTFRSCYFDGIEKNNTFSLQDTLHLSREEMEKSLRHQNADIKLSVLLSAIAGLKHRAISKIIGKPLDTIRVWLSSGRKTFVNDALLKAYF
jgi:DNA-directed RNA polymerase specialized sigma24 family protein